MSDQSLTPPLSFKPDPRGISRADFLIASRRGTRGLLRFETKRCCTIDDAARCDALAIVTSSGESGWTRMGGKLAKCPGPWASLAISRLAVGDAVLRSVLGPRRVGCAIPADQPSTRLVRVRGRFEFRTDDSGYVPTHPHTWTAPMCRTRFVVLTPHGRIGQCGVSCSNAEQLDALPGFANANAIVDNRRDRSFVRFRGVLQPCARDHARWMLMTLAEHGNVLEAMHGLLHVALDPPKFEHSDEPSDD